MASAATTRTTNCLDNNIKQLCRVINAASMPSVISFANLRTQTGTIYAVHLYNYTKESNPIKPVKSGHSASKKHIGTPQHCPDATWRRAPKQQLTIASKCKYARHQRTRVPRKRQTTQGQIRLVPKLDRYSPRLQIRKKYTAKDLLYVEN